MPYTYLIQCVSHFGEGNLIATKYSEGAIADSPQVQNQIDNVPRLETVLFAGEDTMYRRSLALYGLS